MCGIAGLIVNKSKNDLLRKLDLSTEKVVRKMLNVVKHRGPDYSEVIDFEKIRRDKRKNVYSSDFHVVFGHNRLSIIDLSSSGNQPMSDESGRYWIVHNGEIYNYIEIRKELENRGYRFKSSTDTEVILKSYIEWGIDSFDRFNGMWAFCIYDMEKNRVVCSRDRMGIKPFYYYWEPGLFAFSSEKKQLLQLDFLTPKANLNLLADLFLWNLENHTYETFIEGIKKLPPGNYVIIDAASINTTLMMKQYWNINPKNINSMKEAVESFRETFADAVRIRLRSDVPIGITLSGGLDSSSILSFISRYGDNPLDITAFNVDYGISGYGEKEFAQIVADRAGVKLIILRPDFEMLSKEWEKFIWHVEQPIPGLSYYSNFKIYELISAHGIKVNLSGQGGDELLLGYGRYRAFILYFMLKKFKLFKAIRDMIRTQKNGDISIKQQLLNLLYFKHPMIRSKYKLKVVAPYLNDEFVKTFSRERIFHIIEKVSVSNWKELQLKEIRYYQLPHLLNHEDKMSMAHSVESRVPFLDHRLLEIVQSLDLDMIYRDGYSKYILRESSKGILPEEIRLRKDKKGYNTPTGMMIRKNKEFFLELLRRNLDDPIVDTKFVIKNFEDSRLDEKLLCNIVTYFSWKEIFNVKVEF